MGGFRRRRRVQDKERRDGKGILTTQSEKYDETDIEAVSAADDTGALPSEAPQAQYEDWTPDASSTSSSDSAAESAPTPNPNPTDTPCTTSTLTSAQLTDAAWGTSPVASMQVGMATTDYEDLQVSTTGSSSLYLRPSSTENDDYSSIASTSPVAYNTWETGVPDETSSSGLSVASLISLGDITSTSFVPIPTSTDELHSATSLSSAKISIWTTNTSVGSSASALPQIEHMGGTSSTGMARTIAGVTTGSILLVLLIFMSAFAYAKGGAMRGSGFNMHFLAFRPSRHTSSSVNESQENLFRREASEARQSDLENAKVNSGSLYDDDAEDWEVISMADARSGNMEKDNGQWLESWRQGKERMMPTLRPPELRFNPDLPLPPIYWDGEGKENCVESGSRV